MTDEDFDRWIEELRREAAAQAAAGNVGAHEAALRELDLTVGRRRETRGV